MSRVLTLLALCLATSTAAAEGVYFTEAFGGTSYKGDLAGYGDAFRVRISFGYRLDTWAFEGFMAGHINFAELGEGEPTCDADACNAARTVTPPTPVSDSPGANLLTYGVEAKRISRVGKHLELYLGGSLGRGVMPTGYAGNGIGLRAGAQVKGKVPALGFLCWPLFFTGWGPKVTAAVFLENGVDYYRLHDRDRSRAIDAQLASLTFGFAVGSDF